MWEWLKGWMRNNNWFIFYAYTCSKLGLSKVNVPMSHNRKRLAVQSRHHGRPDDSHMFIIKLPPNPFYYGNNKPLGHGKNSIDDYSQKVCNILFHIKGMK